jgi:chemotaxis protein methyltransferase CheR
MLMSEKEFKKLMDFIYRKIGIFIDEKKFKILGRKIEAFIEKKKYDNFRSFFHDIRFNKDESALQSLINIITVNETYFFRENYQFESLINFILPQLDKIRDKNEVIRILCAPSSTGEEPYSIALHLLNEGNLANRRDFEIIGIDIDSSVLEKAKRGIYSQRSIQFLPNNIIREYFTKKDENQYEIAKFLREAIDFKVVNVMDKFALKRLGKFDIVFSRNMLIYFDDFSRKKVAMNFYEIIKPQGYVFLGHAESMNRIVSVFRTKRLGESIVYQKA